MGVIKLAAVSKIEGLSLVTDDTGDVGVKEVNNRCFCFLNRAAAPGYEPLCLGARRAARPGRRLLGAQNAERSLAIFSRVDSCLLSARAACPASQGRFGDLPPRTGRNPSGDRVSTGRSALGKVRDPHA